MAQFDEITEAALDNFGLITAAQAAEMGVRSKDVAEWVRLARLERRGWGVYRIAHYVPTDFDRYAEATTLVGGDAAVWGESVLAMLNLALVNPLRVCVATGKRIRKKLPDWIRLVRKPKGAETENIEGVRCQKLADAVREAGRKGLLGAGEVRKLGKELRS